MVLLLTLEQAALGALPLDVPVTISALVPQAGSEHRRLKRDGNGLGTMPLHADHAYFLSDLLKAVVIASANDAAVAAAEAMAGSVPACVELMNARAQRLGMEATHYTRIGSTPELRSPAPDVTTARDLARLGQALVSHSAVRDWASLTGLPFDGGSILLRNTNQLLGTVAGVDGLQVASATDSEGSVATAQRGALRLIAVVLDAPTSDARYSKAAEMLEWGFAHYDRLEVVKKDERLSVPVRIANGSVGQLTPVAGQTFSLLHWRGDEPNLQVRYQLPAVLESPVERQQQIGEVIIEQQGAVLAVIPALSPINVGRSGILSAALP